MPSDWRWYLMMAAAYLIGSVPFGLLIGLSRGVDIRESGSGNIGATNTGRVLGRKWGLICFVLDVGKGFGPVMVAGVWLGWMGLEAVTPGVCAMWLGVGAAALLGHIFPVYLGFKGGKGVATGFGVILGVWPFLTLPAVGALVVWVLFAGSLRFVGLASVVAAALLPGFYVLSMLAHGWSFGDTWPFVGVMSLMAMLVLVRHAGNLRRLAAGTEPRLGED